MNNCILKVLRRYFRLVSTLLCITLITQCGVVDRVIDYDLGLRLNPEKREILWVGTPGLVDWEAPCHLDCVTFSVKSEVCSLGVQLLTMESQVVSMVPICPFPFLADHPAAPLSRHRDTHHTGLCTHRLEMRLVALFRWGCL